MAFITSSLNLVPKAPRVPIDAVWPLPRKKNLRVSRPNSARALGAARNGFGRTHAGIDLFARHREPVVAITAGQIVSFYYFFRSTYALFIDHGTFVVNYGEVSADSLQDMGLKTPLFHPRGQRTFIDSTHRRAPQYPIVASKGSVVSAGQQIGTIGKMYRTSMLHIEFYSPGIISNKVWNGFNTPPPSGLLNGTDFLLELSGVISAGRLPQKEPDPTDVVCL